MCDAEVRSAAQAARDDPSESACFRRFFTQIGCGTVVALTGWRGTQHIAKEDLVRKWIVVPIAAVLVVGAGRAYAQETTPGPGVVEVTIIPGGVGFVASKN